MVYFEQRNADIIRVNKMLFMPFDKSIRFFYIHFQKTNEIVNSKLTFYTIECVTLRHKTKKSTELKSINKLNSAYLSRCPPPHPPNAFSIIATIVYPG